MVLRVETAMEAGEEDESGLDLLKSSFQFGMKVLWRDSNR